MLGFQKKFCRYACVGMLLSTFPTLVTAVEPYREPSAEVTAVVDAAPTPYAVAGPDGRLVLLVDYDPVPSIAELADPIHRLAGTRISPRTNDRQRTSYVTGVVILRVRDRQKTRVAFPEGFRFGSPVWSPGGKSFALSRATDAGTELWVVNASTGTSRRVLGPRLNGTLGSAFVWLGSNDALLCKLVPADRGEEPKAPRVPKGPKIEQVSGKTSQVRTYQDLLDDAHDEVLFEHYMTSELAVVNANSGHVEPTGAAPGIYSTVEPSPNRKFVLVTRLCRPYSHHVPSYRFARVIEILDFKGNRVRTIAELPVADDVPIGGVSTGPRSQHWRPLEPATVVWVEALDGGDPKRKVSHRDRILTSHAPFTEKPAELARTEHRYRGIDWLEQPDVFLIGEYDRDRHWSRTLLYQQNDPAAKPRVVWDRSVHDRYADPGSPVHRTLSNGDRVVRVDKGSIYLAGSGASPQGDRPFLDRMNLDTLETERLFHCGPKSYESFVALVGSNATTILTRAESSTQAPNYFVRDLKTAKRTALTTYPDPAPWFTKGVRKELIRYQRADGVPLSATLYLPPGYRKGQRLPLVVWAYPREYADPATAGQVRAAPHRFTWLRGTSHLFFLTRGYAVLDGAQLPIIGDPETVNNTFVKQLVSGARAAVDAAVGRGVADPNRVGIAGHSYGAFMTANLLAHSDLFRAGIARSGAYNRTLTPFGFQSERRTFWQAPDTYFAMSPFMHADKINEPILLIHGEADNNSGTFPIQSVRFYHALKGHGATARLVILPHESHGYRARESVLHTLAEMFDWFDAHVKNSPRPSTGSD